MVAFILIVSLSIGTSLLIHRQTKQRFSIIFLAVLLMLFCLTEKRIQNINGKYVPSPSVAVED